MIETTTEQVNKIRKELNISINAAQTIANIENLRETIVQEYDEPNDEKLRDILIAIVDLIDFL